MDPRLLKAVGQFNDGLFFECHETLEEIWLEEHGEDRAFYQGFIQVAAGYLKWEQGVLTGAIKLMRLGLEKLARYPAGHLGIDLASFVQGVSGNLKQIEAAYRGAGEPPSLNVPILRLNAGQ